MDPASVVLSIATARKKNDLHWTPDTVTWAEILAWVENPADQKDTTGYVLGTFTATRRVHKAGQEPCVGMHRVKEGVTTRSALSLDIDSPDPDFIERMDLTWGYAALVHTTYSSAPDDPRYRIIIPVDREMAPDEYIAAAHTVMGMLGEDSFDKSSDQPWRFMYMPAAQDPAWFSHWVYDGPVASVDVLLDGFEIDLSEKPLPAPSRRKRNPFEIEGVIGAFNRAYDDWDLLIETYELPYEKVSDDRYQLAGSKSQAGMGPMAGVDGFVYSHHSNDPAHGKTCSAFDLVRLHHFGHLDEEANPQTPVNKLPSHTAMLDMASTDHRVTAELVGVDFSEAMDEDVVSQDGWRINLRTAARTGQVRDVIQNWDLITANDQVFTAIRFNEMSLSAEFSRDVPWRKVTPHTAGITHTDRWEIAHYMEREYAGFTPSKTRVDAMVDTTAGRNTINPLRDWLETLTWDGKSRIETCLPGVRPTPYTRLVARKSMVAAVARAMEPGCKWDHTLVLYGSEGLGKSWWIEHIAKGWSAPLGNIESKDTLLAMQKAWIVVSDEGTSLRKDEHDAQKEFLTRTADVFRMPYDRETLVHPRHFVIWSTTNDETFLRRQEGNRRFLIVHCEEKVDFGDLTPEYVDQLWAEAFALYQAGEPLFLGEMESATAAGERERFVEEDSLAGVIEEYLETPVPTDWWEKSPEGRAQWLSDRAHGFEAAGTEVIDKVCSRQIWVEALGQRNVPRRADLLEITNAIKRLDGWTTAPGRLRIPGYGTQLTFIRKEDIL